MKDKILVVGDFYFEVYEEAFFNSFVQLGYETKRFKISDYLDIQKSGMYKFIDRFQYKFNIGLSIHRLNKALFVEVSRFEPTLIFIYRGKHILPNLLKTVKYAYPNIKVYNYNNDDAFSKKYPFYFWRLYHKGINFYDHIFCYRQKNIDDLKCRGYIDVSLLKAYYIKTFNFSLNIPFSEKKYDVVFIGHYENDDRDLYIKSLIENSIRVQLFGSGWKSSPYYSYLMLHSGPIDVLTPVQYNQVLNDAKIALVFLSKLNNDEYTRRCFEIPLAGSVMVSERTSTLQEWFIENKEIVFFNSKEELLCKVKQLLKDENLTLLISNNAKIKIRNNHNEAQDRVKEVLSIYHTTKS